MKDADQDKGLKIFFLKSYFSGQVNDGNGFIIHSFKVFLMYRESPLFEARRYRSRFER
jgi:hypothetical protein